MSDNESVVTIGYDVDTETEYGRKVINDDMKNVQKCKLIHYQLSTNFKIFSEDCSNLL